MTESPQQLEFASVPARLRAIASAVAAARSLARRARRRAARSLRPLQAARAALPDAGLAAEIERMPIPDGGHETWALAARPARNRIPTSAVLARLFAEAPAERVSLAWLMSRLQARSFGVAMLLLALVSLLPGAGILAGIVLAFPAVQMMLGRQSPTLPRFLASRQIPTRHLASLVARAVPVLERMETFVHPRWPTPFDATKRLTGFVVLLLAATFISPVPLSQIIPAFVIMLISLAYLEEDGVLMGISLAAAVASLSVTAATVWAAVRATALIDWF